MFPVAPTMCPALPLDGATVTSVSTWPLGHVTVRSSAFLLFIGSAAATPLPKAAKIMLTASINAIRFIPCAPYLCVSTKGDALADPLRHHCTTILASRHRGIPPTLPLFSEAI